MGNRRFSTYGKLEVFYLWKIVDFALTNLNSIAELSVIWWVLIYIKDIKNRIGDLYGQIFWNGWLSGRGQQRAYS